MKPSTIPHHLQRAPIPARSTQVVAGSNPAHAASDERESTTTPERRRAFCLVGVGQERPGKRARTLQPRTNQGTPHPRTATSKSAVQSAIDSADELIAGENITDEEVGLVQRESLSRRMIDILLSGCHPERALLAELVGSLASSS